MIAVAGPTFCLVLGVLAWFAYKPNGDAHLIITTTIQDPEYLTQPYMYSTHFKRQADATGWAPRPCSAR